MPRTAGWAINVALPIIPLPPASEPEQVAQRLGGTAAAAAPAPAAAMDAPAARAPVGRGSGAAEDAPALAEPALDMSRHKSGIIPILKCARARATAARHPAPPGP